MAGSVINCGSKIGGHCIINTRSTLDRNNVVGNFSSIAPGVAIGGNVSIGDFSHIGIGANILHGKEIGSHSIIGAGSVVTKNIDDNTVTYGIPSRFIRKRDIGEKYL